MTELVRRFDSVRVVVIGDVMLDEHVAGTVDRLSPEAPVPVLRVTEEAASLGGAANVARSIVALGGAASLLGCIGEDATGRRLRELCAAAGIDAGGLVTVPGRPSTRKVRITSGPHQLVRADWEDDRPLAPHELAPLSELVASVPAPDAIVVSDYAKGVLTPELLDSIVARARRLGVPLLVDPKHADLRRYHGATLVKLNQVELEAAVARRVDPADPDAVAAAGREVMGLTSARTVVVTLGGRGMVVVRAGRPAELLPADAHDVFDVAGAGDTVIAVLALAMARGSGISEAALLATRAAGLVVRKPGVAVVDRDELVDAATAGAAGRWERAQLLDRIRAWRRQGRRIVFTNGCFDLFHAGHVHLLREAARLGDVLIVALDSDRSVRHLKGADRPVLPEHDRVALVGAIAGVDAVVVFEHDELRRLIAEVAPDVLVKGADYERSQVVGHDIVEAGGGEVVLVPRMADRSTTALVEQIRASSDRRRPQGSDSAPGAPPPG